MYPYLDFFNEPENQMEDPDDHGTGDQDLRSHLNARMGSDRAHPVEPPPQEPINVIHEVPVFPQIVGQPSYQYPMNPMGVPDLNYPWWQGTPQYYPPQYQFTPGVYPQPAYFPMPEAAPNPVNPELRRVQSERRHSAPYPDPSRPSRAPLQTHTEAAEAAEYESPRRRSAFDRLRRSARERLGVREEARRSVDVSVSSYRGDSESSSSRSGRLRGRPENSGRSNSTWVEKTSPKAMAPMNKGISKVDKTRPAIGLCRSNSAWGREDHPGIGKVEKTDVGFSHDAKKTWAGPDRASRSSRGEVPLVQDSRGLPRGLLHLVPTFRMGPLAIAPSDSSPPPYGMNARKKASASRGSRHGKTRRVERALPRKKQMAEKKKDRENEACLEPLNNFAERVGNAVGKLWSWGESEEETFSRGLAPRVNALWTDSAKSTTSSLSDAESRCWCSSSSGKQLSCCLEILPAILKASVKSPPLCTPRQNAATTKGSLACSDKAL
nr:uncharacterized protein LOC109155647 [Ipomoea batatas]